MRLIILNRRRVLVCDKEKGDRDQNISTTLV